MKQPRNTVLTGIKALYLQGLISFNPNIYEFVFKPGASLSYYREKFDNVFPTTQIEQYRLLFTEVKAGYLIYTKERLLLEIDSFDMDLQFKQEAISMLFKTCDYSKVSKVFNTLKKKNGFKPSEAAAKFLDDQRIDFLGRSTDPITLEQYIREYILNRLYKSDIDYIAKGGAVIESYGHFKRGTKDNDAYMPLTRHANIIEVLEKTEDNISFDVRDFNNRGFATVSKYKRARMILTPKSRAAKLSRAFKNIEIQIDADYSLTEKELREIKDTFKVKPRNLWKTKRKYVPLTREMIIAEKVMSALDSQSKRIWRAKDLMDIFVISKENINFIRAKDWFDFKLRYSKYSLKDYQSFAKTLIASREEREVALKGTLKTYNIKDFNWDQVVNIVKIVLFRK